MKELDGAWEANYIGPRVEIKGKKFVRLWRGEPVLTTSFTVKKDGERLVLTLKDNGMRYSGDASPYATVEECFLEDGVLTLKDFFPITGESVDELKKTENSRYGNVTVVNKEILPALQGAWREVGEGDWRTRLVFKKDRMYFGYGDDLHESVQIVCVRNNGDSYGDSIFIIDRDPSKSGVGHFGRIAFRGDTLSTFVPVCDAPNVDLVFKKEK